MRNAIRVTAFVVLTALVLVVAASSATAAVIEGANASALGVKVHVQLLGRELVSLPGTPIAAAPNATGANLDTRSVLGPISVPNGLVDDLRVLTATASRTTGALPAAHAEGQVAHVSLLLQNGKPLIEADAVHAVSDTKCTGPNKALASADGSRLVHLSINGTPIDETPAPNTVIPVVYNGNTPADPTDDRGVKIILNEQTGATKGTGMIVTMIHVIVFDAVTPNLVFADIKIAQAKTSVFCGEAAAPTDTNAADRGVASDKVVTTTTSDIKGATDGSEATALRGDSVTWKITLTNAGTTGCGLVVVTDTLPMHFTFVKSEGDLTTAVMPTADGQTLKWSNPKRYSLQAGGSLTESLTATVDKDAPLGTYTNLLDIDESTCSSFTQGNRGPVTVIAQQVIATKVKAVKVKKKLPATGSGPMPFGAGLTGISLMALGVIARRRGRAIA